MSRFAFGKFRDTFTKYRLKTREKRINLMNYLRTQRQKIIQRQRKKMWNRMLFWSIFTGTSYLIYKQIYQKKMEIGKMNRKLDNFYSSIMQRQLLKDELSCIILKPTNIDQLTNMISLAYRYHYKVIVRMDDMPKREKIIMCQQFGSKCVFVNLQTLNNCYINDTNSTLHVQTGATCLKVNQFLSAHGYEPVFPPEMQEQKIYDVIVNNLPMNRGQLNSNVISFEMVSASGQNFRSAGQTNRYGQIPSLNPLFIGTGGIFALPSALVMKIRKKQKVKEEVLKIGINDDNLRIDALRKISGINEEYIEVQLSNSRQEGNMFMTCTEKYPIEKNQFDKCSQLANEKSIPVTKSEQKPKQNDLHNLFFSINPAIFQSFLLKYGRQVTYSYKNGLLKVKLDNPEDHQKVLAVINEVTNNNGVLVWCSSKELLMRIKPSLDSSQVGAQLMRKIVQVRQGLDRRNIFYSHSRYEQYFAKGMFRRMTQVFW